MDPNKPHAFDITELMEKLFRRTYDWKNLFLSQAGRTTLIKSTLQVIPSYSMQTNLLKKGLSSFKCEIQHFFQ